MGRLRDDIIANKTTCSKWRRRSGCTSSEVEESTSSTTDSESHTHTVPLLEKLKAPKRSDLTRKRAVDHNPPPKGKGRSREAQLTDPKSVSATQRVSFQMRI